MKYLILISILVFAGFSASAQSFIYEPSPEPGENAPCRGGAPAVEILVRNPYKIKAVNVVSSETARVADYVEFKTMEPIYSDEAQPKPLFDKDTSIYAVVTKRKHRHFPFVRGKLEIVLEPLLTWDGRKIEMGIARHGELALNRWERGLTENQKRELQKRNKGLNDPCSIDRKNCVAGRGNAAVAPIVPAFSAASAGAVAAIAKNDETRFIAATAFFSIAKELGNLLNGTDVGISKDEIFNLHIKPKSSFCRIPVKAPSPPACCEPAKEKERP